MIFRKATINDADHLIKFYIERYRKTFATNYDPANLELFLSQHTLETGMKWIQDDHVLVAMENNAIAVFVSAGKCTIPFGKVTQNDGEVKKMYVSETYFGTGLSNTLIKMALDWIKSNFSGSIYISSFSENKRALKFYQKHGFEVVGTCIYPVGNHQDLDYVLRNKE